jgi:hypothetical protein
MAFTLRDGQGQLWPARDRKSDKSPNSTGTAMLDGRKVLLAGWTKQTQNGVKWLSLSVKWADEDQTDPRTDDVNQAPPDLDGGTPF